MNSPVPTPPPQPRGAPQRPLAPPHSPADGEKAGDSPRKSPPVEPTLLQENPREEAKAENEGCAVQANVAGSPDFHREMARLKPEQEGDRIGHYTLLEEIGSGGFGTVWRAEQEEPVRRRVALKIIKMGMDKIGRAHV